MLTGEDKKALPQRTLQLPNSSKLRKRSSTDAVRDAQESKKRIYTGGTERKVEPRPEIHDPLPKRISHSLDSGAAPTRSDSACGFHNTSAPGPSLYDTNEPLPPDQIFDCLLNSILQLIDCPFVGFAIRFITEMVPHEHLLLFCSNTVLKTTDLYNEFSFTDDQISSIECVYKDYTGAQISHVRKTLTELLECLRSQMTDEQEITKQVTKNDVAKKSEMRDTLVSIPDSVREDWVEYLVSKLLLSPGKLAQKVNQKAQKVNQEDWEQIGIGYCIMVERRTVLDLKKIYKPKNTMNDAERVLRDSLRCPKSDNLLSLMSRASKSMLVTKRM